MRPYLWMVMLAVATIVLPMLFGCQPVRPAPSGDKSRTPDEVVLGAAEGFGEDEEEVTVSAVDESMAYFAEDAVYELVGLPTGTETYTGRDEIHDWMAGLLDNDFRVSVEILESDGANVVTETKTWMTWSRQAGIAPLVAREEYVVEDGQITHVTWTLSQDSLEQLMSVMGGQ